MKVVSKSEDQRYEIIIEHYSKWVETATDEYHRKYAELMLQAAYDNKYKQVFKELSQVEEFVQPKVIYHKSRWKRFMSLDAYLNKAS
jgi:hypothetical protein